MRIPFICSLAYLREVVLVSQDKTSEFSNSPKYRPPNKREEKEPAYKCCRGYYEE